jgi:uncharacterized SAM-binding protein YcdF (DUF218 family)
MIYLHKVLPFIISPIALILVLLIFGLYKNSKKLIIIGTFFLFALSMPIVGNTLLRQVELNSVRMQPSNVPQADAIVVLSGMLNWVPAQNGLIQEWGDPDRFWGGIELMKANKAPKLIFTGGKVPWELGQGNEGEYLKKFALLLGVPEQKIMVTPDVQNTEEESTAVSELLKEHRDIILVTSAFHMMRAKSVFESKGLSVFAYPVDFRVFENSITLMSFLPSPGGIGQVDLAIRELTGVTFYMLKTWLNDLKIKYVIKQ